MIYADATVVIYLSIMFQWWNWYTHRPEKPGPNRACGFESHLGQSYSEVILKKLFIIFALLILLVSCAKKETSEDYSVERSNHSETQATLKHFNYEDAKKLQPGEFISVTMNGGSILKVSEGYIVSIYNGGSIYLTDEEFKGKEK